ncbi:MAG: hypothetical protein LBK06_01180 [Planctomycetaceae bacterium]|nr:hypothetical protein [Planctomycetaceae bacterium]
MPKNSDIHENASNVSYFSSKLIRGGHIIYECDLTLESFLSLAKEREWGIKEITDQPIKMIRYRYGVTSRETFNKERNELLPESENNTSCFHFVKHGYYYVNEKTPKPEFIHVAYDTSNGKMYLYRNIRGGGFDMQYINGNKSIDQNTHK